MSRVGDWLQHYNSLFSRFKTTVFFDVGSNYTRVVRQGRLVFNQPTCLAVHRDKGSILAIGTKAFNYLGKTPPYIKVVFPVDKGRVTDSVLFRSFIESVIKELPSANKKTALLIDGWAGLVTGLSPVEESLFETSFRNSGVSSLKTVPMIESVYERFLVGQNRNKAPKEKLANAESYSSNSEQNTASSICIFDVGGRKTELGLFVANRKVFSTQIDIGGDDFTEAIQEIVRVKYHLAIGWVTAERLKKEMTQVLGSSEKSRTKTQMVVRGKDLIENLVKTVKISVGDFEEAYTKILGILLDEVKESLVSVSADVVAETFGRGIYLTGGGSNLSGLADYLQSALATEVKVSRTPDIDGVMGLAVLHKQS